MTKCPQCGKDLIECRCVEVVAERLCQDDGYSLEQMNDMAGIDGTLPYYAQAIRIVFSGPGASKH